MKKLCVCVSGWHYPLHFYKSIAEQSLPDDWKVDLFIISHRDPKYAKPEVKKYLSTLGEGLREDLDRKLYEKVATKSDLKKLGWKYVEKPNTIGDWGNANQWLEDNDYKEYDLFLFTHDDNLIINQTMFYSVIKSDYDKWDILANSTGMPPGNLRGSFEFFKRETLDKIGGKFDLSQVTLTREGKTDTPDREDLLDWNATVYPLTEQIKKHNLTVLAMSPCYRVSMFCIEGERGFISKTHGINTAYEEQGLNTLKQNNLI